MLVRCVDENSVVFRTDCITLKAIANTLTHLVNHVNSYFKPIKLFFAIQGRLDQRAWLGSILSASVVSNNQSPTLWLGPELHPLPALNPHIWIPRVPVTEVPTTFRAKVGPVLRQALLDEIEEHDPSEVRSGSIVEVNMIIQVFKNSRQKYLAGNQHADFIGTSSNTNIISFAEVQKGPYLHHAIRKAQQSRSINCSPIKLADNSTIVYKLISTIRPSTQVDLITRFNIIEREVKNQNHTNMQAPSTYLLTNQASA